MLLINLNNLRVLSIANSKNLINEMVKLFMEDGKIIEEEPPSQTTI